MSIANSMDPHKAPPQGLKDLFKELRSIKNIDDHQMEVLKVVDFGISSRTEYTERLHFLEKVFDNFNRQSSVTDPVMLEAVPPSANFYTIDGVPGVGIYPGIFPPMTQRVLLDRLLHRDLSNSKHQTNLHLHYNVSYPSNDRSFFTISQSDVLFLPKDPSVHKELEMNHVLQKKLRWVTLGGQYDWTNKVYPEEAPPEFPSDIANLIRGLFDNLLDPQAAIVNVYSPGDTLSLHRDVSEEVDMPLISVSIGCECLFLVAIEDVTSKDGFKHATIRLRSGDALVMRGEARFAWHGVPKIFPETCPNHLASWPNDGDSKGPYSQWTGWMRNKRINLNIRQMH